jgi:hypothetical protein
MERIRKRISIRAHAIFLAAVAILVVIDQAEAQRAVRGQAAQSVHSSGSAANRGANANANRSANANVNRNTTVNRNTNVNIDVDNDWDHNNGWNDHPVAAGVAFGTAAAVTAAAIGSMVYTLPPVCGPRPHGPVTYYYCDNVWYQPQYSGTSVTYIVVNAPG